MTLTYGELCAGYGGLYRGIQSVLGGELAWYSEFDPAPSKAVENAERRANGWWFA